MRTSRIGVVVFAGLLAVTLAGKQSGAIFTYPGATWESIETPAASGYSLDAIATLRRTVQAGPTTGMLIVVGGRILFTYGAVEQTSYIASARKSLISMLYGKYAADGTVDIGATLRELDINDIGGLLPVERDATVGDLLRARSGVYHPAANAGDASALAPTRGSVRPGSYFLYNNWDFNALGTILERATGRTVYDLFSDDIAIPLGLEDWNASPGANDSFARNDTGLSQFPAHHFVLSTRDMARLGYLMLRRGEWNGRRIIPAEWVTRTTRVTTSAEEVRRTSPFVSGLGYGYLWWTLDEPGKRNPALTGAYTASGAFGQFITVIPALDMVVAHKVAVPPDRNLSAEIYLGTIIPQAVAVAAR